ncbi:MAG: hypothetical protein ACTS8Z_05050 [Candidatus Limnocylindrales bacterium]
MGELHELTGGGPRRVRLLALTALVVGVGCGPTVVDPSPPATGSVVPSTSAGPSASSDASPSGATASLPGTVSAAEGRLVWLVDAGGRAGLWTTDLAGGDPVTYLAGLDEGTTTIRDPLLVGEAVVFIADRPGGSELRVVLPGNPIALLLDRVVAVQPDGPDSVIAVRDEGSTRQIVRVRVGGQ